MDIVDVEEEEEEESVERRRAEEGEKRNESSEHRRVKEQVRILLSEGDIGVHKKKILKRWRRRRPDEKEFKLVDNVSKGCGKARRQ